MVTQFVLPFLSGSLIDVLFFKYPIYKNLCNHINNNIYISDYPCWKGYLSGKKNINKIVDQFSLKYKNSL